MLSELGEGLKKVVLAGIGAVAMTAEKSEELIEELVKKGELTAKQGKVLNEELRHKVKEAVQEGKAMYEKKCEEARETQLLNELVRMTPAQRAALKCKLEELEAMEQNETKDAEA